MALRHSRHGCHFIRILSLMNLHHPLSCLDGRCLVLHDDCHIDCLINVLDLRDLHGLVNFSIASTCQHHNCTSTTLSQKCPGSISISLLDLLSDRRPNKRSQVLRKRPLLNLLKKNVNYVQCAAKGNISKSYESFAPLGIASALRPGF